MTHPVDTLLFDLDGTLLDNGHLHEAVIATVADLVAADPTLDGEALLAANAAAHDSYWPAVQHDWLHGLVEADVVAVELWRRTLESQGRDAAALVTRAAAIHARRELAMQQLYPDTLAALEYARTAGLRTALVTNGASDTQRRKLVTFGLDHGFDAVIISGEVGAAKPDPAIFTLALAAVGSSARSAVHIGDNLVTDVGGAAASGIRSIWINRNATVRQPTDVTPDLEVSTLAELPAILAR